jgi:hypothetical protein
MNDNEKLVHLRQSSLMALKTLSGLHWQDVYGELHIQFGELPTWVLLYTDSDIRAAHHTLYAALRPYMDAAAPLQFTVSYLIITPDLQITVEALMDHDDIVDALTRPDFGKVPTTNRRLENGLFSNAISGLTPSNAS